MMDEHDFSARHLDIDWAALFAAGPGFDEATDYLLNVAPHFLHLETVTVTVSLPEPSGRHGVRLSPVPFLQKLPTHPAIQFNITCLRRGVEPALEGLLWEVIGLGAGQVRKINIEGEPLACVPPRVGLFAGDLLLTWPSVLTLEESESDSVAG